MNLDNPEVLLRGARNPTLHNAFDMTTALFCTKLGIPYRLFKPEEGGRDQNFYRDIEMVKGADVVICVFPEAAPMDGGTGHLVEKAQDRGVPVYAYTSTDADPRVWRRLGEWDPNDSWSARAPSG